MDMIVNEDDLFDVDMNEVDGAPSSIDEVNNISTPRKARNVTSYTRAPSSSSNRGTPKSNAVSIVSRSNSAKARRFIDSPHGTSTATFVANEQITRMDDLHQVIQKRESSHRFTEHWETIHWLSANVVNSKEF